MNIINVIERHISPIHTYVINVPNGMAMTNLQTRAFASASFEFNTTFLVYFDILSR